VVPDDAPAFSLLSLAVDHTGDMTTFDPGHLIFDCDGVLVDSETIAVRIESEILTAAGFPMTVPEIMDQFVGLNYASVKAWLENEFGRPLPDDILPSVEARVLEAFPTELEPIPGMHALLERNDLPRCVASSSDPDRIRLSLEVTDLDRHFEDDFVFSAQMVERGKPEPDLFLMAADRLGASPASCLVIEDSPHGVLAAVRAGMPVIGLVAGGHAGPGLADRLRDAGASHVVDNVDEILPV